MSSEISDRFTDKISKPQVTALYSKSIDPYADMTNNSIPSIPRRRFENDYTGILDKYGIQIKEGDFLKGYEPSPETVYRVVYYASKYSAGFVGIKLDDDPLEPIKGWINIWYSNLELVV